ncbi:glycine--tRNA ligase beta subunit [endosymbiont of Euscepes postfasciatus]|uniref:glycine--tRNA ligase subunit beta n=1 Tax=endosymbiont of Euscepes postfasciatus TaxID=650377 RepID=UPI000DC6E3CE|nr:glycine--tRNA ligase subunit beta [endosymbiont of Euscepes postfasciatus]BBA84737.1 glycine--tRNA ligase beta subunit [endosymbiont of Euscepes postfasciatus]
MIKNKNNLLLEIYIENIPNNFVISLSNIFFDYFTNKIKNNFYINDNIEYISTNKRLGFIIKNFLIKKNVNLTKNIKIYKIVKENILDSINYILKKFNIMKWNNSNIFFIRPIRNILLLFNNKILKIKIFNLESNNFTYKNFFDKENKIIINNIKNYYLFLRKNNIIINFNDRKFKIKKYIEAIEKKLNGNIIINNALLKKISYLYENPNIFYIKIYNNLFIDKNIMINILYKYYNYLLIMSNLNNKLLPYIVCVSNIKINKNIKYHYKNIIINYFKKIKILFNLDKRYLLLNNFDKFKKIIFRKEFGSMYHKILRITNISFLLSKKSNLNIDYKKINLSCFLYKNDINSNLVKEFFCMKGYINSYFLNLNKNINKDIIILIKEQCNINYIKNNKLNYLSFLILLVDKIDNIVCNLYFYFLKNKNNLDNDPFFIKKDINFIINILLKNDFYFDINYTVRKLILYTRKYNKDLYYNVNFNKYLFFIKKIIFIRFKLFFLKINKNKHLVNFLITKNIKIFNINLILNIIKKYNNEFKFISIIFKRIINLLKKNKNKIKINNYKFYYNNLSKLEKKFLNILLYIEKIIKKKDNDSKFNLIILNLFKLSNFIKYLLNKIIVINNNNLIYLLFKYINFINKI